MYQSLKRNRHTRPRAVPEDASQLSAVAMIVTSIPPCRTWIRRYYLEGRQSQSCARVEQHRTYVFLARVARRRIPYAECQQELWHSVRQCEPGTSPNDEAIRPTTRNAVEAEHCQPIEKEKVRGNTYRPDFFSVGVGIVLSEEASHNLTTSTSVAGLWRFEARSTYGIHSLRSLRRGFRRT